MKSEPKNIRSMSWSHVSFVYIPLFACTMLALVFLPFSYSCSPVDSESGTKGHEVKGKNKGDDIEDDKGSNKDGSSAWKNWNNWVWEQPTYDELNEQFPEYKSWGFTVEFFSVWDERFQNHPNAADGFIVFHLGSRDDLTDVELRAIPHSEELIVLGGESAMIDLVPGREVISIFVPLKAPDATGEYEISVFVMHTPTGELIENKIYMIKKHRREIFGLSWGDYYFYKWQERLSEVEKRPGAEFYKPRDLGEPAIPIIGEVGEPDPDMTGFYEYLMATEVPPEEGPPYDEYLELFMDVEPAVTHSGVSYSFRGYIYFTDLYEGLPPKPLVGAAVCVIDDDDIRSGDDKICCGVTNENGKFSCVGSAEDQDGSNPDPYVVVAPYNDQAKVLNCSQHPATWLSSVFIDYPDMWNELKTPNVHGMDNLPGGNYQLTQQYNVSVSEYFESQFMTLAHMNKTLNRNLDAWNAAKNPGDPERVHFGFHNACVPYKNVASARHRRWWEWDWGVVWKHRLEFDLPSARSRSTISHETAHSIHQRLIGLSEPVPGESVSDPGPCDYNQNIGLAFSDGFANATPLFVYNSPQGYEGSKVHFKYDKYSLTAYYDLITTGQTPDHWMKGACSYSYEDTVIEGVKQALCDIYPVGHELHDDYCPIDKPLGWQGKYVMDSSEKAQKGCDEVLVACALIDLYDGSGYQGTDKHCEYHFLGAERDACDTWYADENDESWGLFLLALDQNPRNYFKFIEKYYAIVRDRAISEGISFDECEVQNYLRATSRFNGITLDGIFGLESDDWGYYDVHPFLYCDKWEITPEIGPPPCAATQAVVAAVEDGVESVTITPEEGEALLDRIRSIRDDYLLNSVRGRYYAFLYSTCSDEIVDVILGNPQITLTALDLMEDAAEKLDNLENYVSSGTSPIDENFVFLTMTILEELKAHTSAELLSSVAIVEGDLEVIHGLTVEEILDYFEWEP